MHAHQGQCSTKYLKKKEKNSNNKINKMLISISKIKHCFYVLLMPTIKLRIKQKIKKKKHRANLPIKTKQKYRQAKCKKR